MLPRSQSNPGGGENFGVKKKKAPPRPPQPSLLKLQNSQFQSFRETKSYNQRSQSISNPMSISRPKGSDLISFDSPPNSPQKSIVSFPKTVSRDSEEFMYRIGASIFYIKSPLKNSTELKNSAVHPFSPPRPSALLTAQFATPTKTINNAPASQTNTYNTTSNTNHSKNANPTIIKQQQQNHGASISSNNGSGISTTNSHNNTNNNTWTNNNSQQHQQQQHQQPAQTRYSNIPLVWDEPPKKIIPPNKPATAPKPTILRPTIIRPTPTTTTTTTTATTIANNIQQTKRNYYDEPPGEDFDEDNNFDDDDDDDDDEDDDVDCGVPMPSEAPPPPPENLELNEWVEGSTTADSYYEQLPEPYGTVEGAVEGDRAYAIALYDYTPEAEGDLALQAGDLVYLTKKVDESWLYGTCGTVYGMFPSNYVNVVVPLPIEQESTFFPQENPTPEVPQTLQTSTAASKYFFAKALYQFNAETENDLSLEPGDVVTIWGKINEDWLYGSKDRKQGQFPSAFVSPVPSDLPILQLE